MPEDIYNLSLDILEQRKQEFIRKAREKHGDLYNYSEVVYKDCRTKVIITCPKHGKFEQKPEYHLAGRGCPKCGVEKCTSASTGDTNNFVQKARKIHGNYFDYSLVRYRNSISKVSIICPTHGEFKQRPSCHLRGKGCLKCKNDSERYTNDTFIEKSKLIHNNRYDYSKVEYKSCRIKVCITCSIHGPFWQTPRTHLKGNGCPECGAESTHNKQRSSTDEFIKRASTVHNNRYGYADVVYINAATKVKIQCPVHGPFWQNPDQHLRGSGCTRCENVGGYSESMLRNNKHISDKIGELYVVKIVTDSECFLKVGITRGSAFKRSGQFYGRKSTTIIDTRKGAMIDLFRIEQDIKFKFKQRFDYEPHIKFAGHTECYEIKALLDICEYLEEVWPMSPDHDFIPYNVEVANSVATSTVLIKTQSVIHAK